MASKGLTDAVMGLKAANAENAQPGRIIVPGQENFSFAGAAQAGRKFTDEQEAILCCPAQTMKIQAYAGCAKTSTMVEFARRNPGLGMVYLAYNKAISQQAQKSFGANVRAKTSHSFAYAWLLKSDRAWKDAPGSKFWSVNKTQIAQLMGDRLKSLGDIYGTAGKMLVLIEEFIKSDAPDLGEFIRDNWTHATAKFIDLCCEVWASMTDPSGRLSLGHDGYLKLWTLSPALIEADALLIDECQDSSAALLGKLAAQSHLRKIFVGDQYQSIYGFRGAINALDKIAADAKLHLTKSFRFGSNIAQAANGALFSLGAAEPVIGAGREDSVAYGQAPIGKQIMHVSRSNAGLFETAVKLAKAGKSVHFPGGAFKLDGFEELLSLKNSQKKLPQRDGSDYSKAKNIGALEDLAAENGDREMLIKIGLVNEHGNDLPKLVELINKRQTDDLSKAQAILCTAHRSKGLEANWVELADDFYLDEIYAKPLAPVPKELKEEAHILYVAMTRAKAGLHMKSKQLWDWSSRCKALMQTPRPGAGGQHSRLEAFALKGACGGASGNQADGKASRL